MEQLQYRILTADKKIQPYNGKKKKLKKESMNPTDKNEEHYSVHHRKSPRQAL
jgi:hypothetical protein